MSYIAIEYWCAGCQVRFDYLETRSAIPPHRLHRPCGSVADRVLSAPLPKLQLATVTRGKSDPPPPNAIDTRPLAAGMPVSEWRQKYRKTPRGRA